MRERREAALKGHGLFLYQNISNADMLLPKPTKAGRLKVGPHEKFLGDSYFKNIRELACLQEIKETVVAEEKLITETPPTVTPQGTVEFVVADPKAKPLNEDKPADGQSDVLLSEAPAGAIRVMR